LALGVIASSAPLPAVVRPASLPVVKPPNSVTLIASPPPDLCEVACAVGVRVSESREWRCHIKLSGTTISCML
jgi:hypothetical protein